MARRVEPAAIFSDDIDRFLGRILGATLGIMVTFLVLTQLWFWLVKR